MKERKNLYQFVLKLFPSPTLFFQPSCCNRNGVESKLIVLQKDEQRIRSLLLFRNKFRVFQQEKHIWGLRQKKKKKKN